MKQIISLRCVNIIKKTVIFSKKFDCCWYRNSNNAYVKKKKIIILYLPNNDTKSTLNFESWSFISAVQEGDVLRLLTFSLLCDAKSSPKIKSLLAPSRGQS